MDHANPSEVDEENILRAALSTAFTPTHSPRNSLHQGRRRSNITNIPSDLVPVESASTESTSSQSTDDPWKAEYEAQVESWRVQSADAREKAEKERARWEAMRAAEKAEADRRTVQVHDSEHGWETVGAKNTSDPSSSQQTRDPVLGEPQTIQLKPDTSRQDTCDDTKLSSSQKWEDLHSSQTSSFPSLSFPDNPGTPSPGSQPASNTHPTPAAAPFSATLTIFDTTLPTRTRVSALFSSLAINMLLPFVNGVMLGFGEIFAKNVVIGWFGWKMPRTVATNVGVGVRPLSEHKWRTG